MDLSAFRLPAPSSPVWGFVDPCHLESALAARSSIPSFSEARASAKRCFAATKDASAVVSLTLRADDSIELIEFGPRGGSRTIWRF